MRTTGKNSIKYKLFVSQISLILVATILFFGISAAYFVIKTKDDVVSNMQYSSSINASNIYSYLSNMKNCLSYASYNLELADMLSEKKSLSVFERQGNYNYICENFKLVQENYSFPIQLTVYPANEYVTTIDGLHTDKMSNLVKDSFQFLESSSRFLYFIDTKEDKSYFCMMSTLYSSSNYSDIVGYIKVSTELSLFEAVLENCTMADSVSILLNNDGMICSSDKESGLGQVIYPLLRVSETEMDTIKLGREKYFAVKKMIENTNYCVVVIQNIASVYKTTYFMFLILLVILIFIFGASFSISHLISGSVINMLDILINAMKKTRFGELKTIDHYENQNTEINEVISAYNHMITSIKDLIAYNNSYAEQIKKYEFDSLQMQIKPHFLYNTLDIIQYLVKENKTDDVVILIKNLSRFYKISLHNKNDVVKIENEIKHISYYVAIENFKHDNAVELEIDVPYEIQQLHIPKITFQPIVENSIKHGILEKDMPEGRITITAERDKDDIYIYIVDNGIGISRGKIEDIMAGKLDSIGIVNTDQRLKNFYGSDYGISMEGEEGKYTKVIIKIKGVQSDEQNNDC